MNAAGDALLGLAAAASLAALVLGFLGRFLDRPGLSRWAVSALWAVLGAAGAAILVLLGAFLSHDFGNLYVYEHSARSLPWVYTVSALWAGNAGSLLLWLVLMGVFSVVASWGGRRGDPGSTSYLAAVFGFINLFFSLLVLFGPGCNPFAGNPISPTPSDGFGLNPMLRHPGMVIHPLTLYIGFVAMAVPFGIVVAGLANGGPLATWIRGLRRWVLAGWLFLTVGNVVGAWWAYVTLGWGGYWSWDPVENASLVPWLAATALLHSAVMAERRQRHQVWTVSLAVLTFLLTIFGTFLTRTGVALSVHAFTQPQLIPWFAVFMAVMLVVAVVLIVWRYRLLNQADGTAGPFSESSNGLYTVVLLLAITFFILWGVVFPPLAHALVGREMVLGPGFFNSVTAPLGIALLLLLVTCSLLSASRGSRRRLLVGVAVATGVGVVVLAVLLGKGVRGGYPLAAFALIGGATAAVALVFAWGRWNRRRYGALLAHLGLLVLVVGLAGSWAYKDSVEGELSVGESLSLGELRVVYQDVETQAENTGDRSVTRARLALSIDGKDAGELGPSVEFYPATHETWTRVARRTSAAGDVYVSLLSVDLDAGTAEFRLEYHPLIVWIWVGGGIMSLGALVAFWSLRHRDRLARLE